MIYKFIHCSLRRFVRDTLDNVVLIVVDFKHFPTSRHFIFSVTHFSRFNVIILLCLPYLIFEAPHQLTVSN